MEFRLLGPLEASVRGRAIPLGPPKQRALLARLLLDVNRTVSAEQLIDDLWGDELPDSAAKMVQIYVSGLRKVLPDGVLRTRAPGYVLEAEPEAVDLLRFDTVRAKARAALDAGDPRRTATLLREALALWRGPALAEFTEPFAEHERMRLEGLRLACLTEWIDAELALGRHADVIGQLESLVAREPLREALQAQLMLALYRSGRQADALATYQDFRRHLDEELGIDPSPRLRSLERAILMQDPDLDAAPVAPPEPAPPPVPVAVAPDVAAPVGREAEIERLRRALGQALGGRRRAVFVTGEPGAGKSTLVAAFAEQVEGEVFVARGECVEHSGPGEPYLPLLDTIGHCVAAGGEEMLAHLRERAPTWLVQTPWLVDAAELEALERRVGGTTRERMLREMIEALEDFASRQPILLVLEDLQWSDGATLDLLAALLRRSAPARILVVATCAPPRVLAGEDELRALVHGLCLRGVAEELPLGRLGVDALSAHLAARFGGVPPDGLAELLRARAGGNPLFVGRLLDHWLSEGSIVAAEDGLRLGVSLAELAIGLPATLRAWLEDRVAELPADDAELLRAASLVGREFAVDAVAAALERSHADVAARCAVLARENPAIEPAGEVRWADGTVSPAYRFAHDVHREVLSELLAPEERVAAHRRIGARLLEAQGDDPQANATDLARHFLAGRDPARAVRFLKLAAERSFARRAYREGIAHVRAALEAAGQLPPGAGRSRWEVELHSMLGQAVVAVDGWSAPEAERCLVIARELAEGLHDNEPLMSVLLALATLYEVRGEYARAERIIEEGAGLLPADQARGRLQTQELLACSLFHQGSFARALEHADEGVSLFDPADPGSGGYDTFPGTLGDDAGVTCHDWAALAMWFVGRPDSALARARHALELSDDPMRAHSRATACAQLAVVHQCRREPAQVLEWSEEAIAAARDRGYAYRVAMGRVLRGWALARLGQRERGIDEIACGMRASRATGGHMDDPYYLALLAESYLDAGELDAGLSAVAEALEIGRRERSLFFESELLRLRALLALRADGADLDAERDLHAAIAVARRQGSPSLELRAALDLARLRRQAGRAAEARGAVAPLLEGFGEGHDTPDLREAAALIAVPAGAS